MSDWIEQLSSQPASADALQQTIQALDACFLNGFVGAQSDALAALPHLFAGTPLAAHLTESIDGITQNAFMDSHFVALAAARNALQGTLYDVLNAHVHTALGRSLEKATLSTSVPQPDPLLDSVRHWLMEVAIAGFARLEMEAVLSFSTTLAQVRANPATASQGAVLTGFWHEILESMPIKDADDVPLTRWCDLWSLLMVRCVGLAESPGPTPVSGTLYSLGLEMRAHARAASLVVYSLLSTDAGSQLVRTTWNSFKVAAIQGDEVWLLFPEAQPLLDSLSQGKFLTLEDMPLLPTGDLLWVAEAARTGKKYKWREVAEQTFAAGKTPCISALPPLERHPIQIAAPVFLSGYRVEDKALHWENGLSLALDDHHPRLDDEALGTSTGLFGMMHYDAGKWTVQPLSGDDGKTLAFLGSNGATILKKPPKTSTVSILRERAGRLLRKRNNA